MYQYTCLNPISPMGLEQLPGDYVKTETVENAGRDFGEKRIHA